MKSSCIEKVSGTRERYWLSADAGEGGTKRLGPARPSSVMGNGGSNGSIWRHGKRVRHGKSKGGSAAARGRVRNEVIRDMDGRR